MRLKLQSRHLSLRTKLIWLFVVIKVLPLLLLAVLAWEGFRLLGDRVQRQTEQLTGDVRLTVGGMAETLSRQAQEALNARAREELERLTTDTARRVAEFLYSRDVDIQQAARLAPSPAMYSLFMAGRTRHLVDGGRWQLSADATHWVPEEKNGEAVVLPVRSSSSNTENDNAFHYRPPEPVRPNLPAPLYHEMTFVGLDGWEKIKIAASGELPRALRDVSRPENTWSKAETYFAELKKLKPGEIYVSEVIGPYVGSRVIGQYTPAAAQLRGIDFAPEEDAYAGRENPLGKRFRGLVRWATPVVENGRISGYVTLALNHDHLMAITENLLPTSERYARIADASSGNYAFMWDHKDRAIAHPRHHSLVGFDPATGRRVMPWLEESIYERWQASGQPLERFLEQVQPFEAQTRTKRPAPALTAAGTVGLDCRYLNFAPQCVGWHDLTRSGGSGSFLILWSGVWKITTAAAIPYFTGQYGQTPRGFGFVTIGANIEDFQLPAVRMGEQLEQRVGRLERDIETQQQAIRASISESVRSLGIDLVWSTLIMIGVVIGVAFWLAWLIARRIGELILGLRKVEAGDYAYRFEKHSEDELGKLTDSLNRMAHHVESAYEDLKDAKRSEEVRLAAMVEQRTEELRHARFEAEKASSAKSLFLANMSHEIRTPLNGVLGLAQIGLRERGVQPKARETFRRIVDSGRLLLRIINDILDFSKIEAGKLEVERVPFSPAAVIAEALRAMRPEADAKSLSLVSEVDTLPPVCLGDPARLQQILLNLLSNAVKFTVHGGIRLSVARDGEDLVFRVIDSGIGIDTDDLRRLFEPFEQADSSTTRKYGGTGLGLTISARLAALMGGRLTAESRVGEGSVFILRLPLPESDAPLPEPAHSEIGRGERRLHGVRLLVAEDNEVNRLVIEAMLQGEGAEVVMADDGAQAVQALADGLRVDAVLMDVQMPEMDGLEATRRIRARHPQLPVIGQTAHALKDEHARCLAAGMVATVNKPIEIEALVEMILSQLGHLPAPSLVPAAEREMTPSADETASSEGEAPLPVVDWAALEARYSGRREFIERLLALAFEQHVEDAERLKALAREARYEEVATLAHRLKGMAGNLCAHEFEAQAQRYLQSVRGGAAPSAAMIDALIAASERLLGELKGGRPDA